MRIIAGEYKYRRIRIPEGIRPTTEKVREAVFSMLGDAVAGASVLDTFAGSGVLGLEALSRGAESCVFIEQSRKNAEVLRENINNCGAGDRSTVLCRDFRRVLPCVEEAFDIVLLDPPYESGYYLDAMSMIAENHLLREGGFIIAEHIYDNKLSDELFALQKIKEKRYGSTGVDVFTRR